jgi:2-polyprenyl-3-methyl-5-hydroxy-6-metoxy-1,4-benzoquinol methylase
MPHDSELKTWESTKALLGNESVHLGPYLSYQVRHTPRRLLFSMSYNKFAAKVIGADKSILEIGCGEGLTSTILAEFSSRYVGVDIDGAAIAHAQNVFSTEQRTFHQLDIMTDTALSGPFDAVASFDVIEHIHPQNEGRFLDKMMGYISPQGTCLVGTPNVTSAPYASAVTNAGHVNLFSADRLRETLLKYFRTVFIFSANDEVVHTGYFPMAHYLIGYGLDRKTGNGHGQYISSSRE